MRSVLPSPFKPGAPAGLILEKLKIICLDNNGACKLEDISDFFLSLFILIT